MPGSRFSKNRRFRSSLRLLTPTFSKTLERCRCTVFSEMKPVIVPGFASFLLPIVLVFLRPDSVPLSLALANAACGLIGLFVTVALEMPRHTRLEKGASRRR